MTSHHPIGYVEVQKAWIGTSDGVEANADLIMYEVSIEMARDYPTYKKINSNITCVKDGAGVNHYTLYVGYAPAQPPGEKAEPLNPHNLNSSDNLSIGDPARDNAIGMKEQRFSR